MSKKIKESEAFVVSWGKKGGRIVFFVRYKNIIRSTPVAPVDLARFLIDKIKKIEK
jgi:hypothetical protein